MTMNPLFVSMHTDDDFYRAHSDRLVKSLRVARLPHIIQEIPRQDRTWAELCALKVRFLLATRLGHANPLVWVDADAEVVNGIAATVAFRDLGASHCDLAVYRTDPADATRRFPLVNSRLLSGTMYFANTDGSIAVLKEWLRRLDEKKYPYEQDALADTLDRWNPARAIVPRVANLNPSLVCVPDLMPGVVPVIKHHQASRDPRSGKE